MNFLYGYLSKQIYKMGQGDIDNAVASDLTNAMTDFSVDTISTDGPQDQKETEHQIKLWPQRLGYYKKIPELKRAINAAANWTAGKGWTANAEDTVTLQNIKGHGKDSFTTIIKNDVKTYYVGGTSFNQIILDDDGNFVNLKPLDPDTISTFSDRQGMIIRFEQRSKVKLPNKKFDPGEIFYLPRERIADEILGQSLIEELENIILSRNEAMDDWKRVLHRNVDPMMIFHLDEDDTVKVAAFKKTTDAARGKGENMYIPKDAVVPEQLSIAPNAALNPIPWIAALNQYFFQSSGVPQIIVGGSGEFSEATAKIAYLAYQQTIKAEQLFIEEQIELQLGLKIKFNFPASIENDLLSGEKKEGPVNIQPNETTAGAEESNNDTK